MGETNTISRFLLQIGCILLHIGIDNLMWPRDTKSYRVNGSSLMELRA